MPNDSSSSSLPSQNASHDNFDNSFDTFAYSVPIRRSTMIIQQPKKFDSYVRYTTSYGLYNVDYVSSDYLVSLNNVLTSPAEPSSYTQAKHDPRKIAAMDAEIKVLLH